MNNEYADEALLEAPPPVVDISRVTRNILAEKPRVTRFPIAFDAPAPVAGAAGYDGFDAGMGVDDAGAAVAYAAAAAADGPKFGGYGEQPPPGANYGGFIGAGSNSGFGAADGGEMMMA